MLVWPIAAKEPSTIEAIDTNTRICCHCETMPGKAVSVTRVNTASAATFGADAKKAVTGVGAPSYTSGVHMWNCTAETLKQRPASWKTRQSSRPTFDNVAAAALPVKATVPVKP